MTELRRDVGRWATVALVVNSMVGAGIVALPARVDALVGAPRYHHQWWPDRVEVEPGAFGAEWRADLEALGHQVQSGKRRWGNMQAVFRSKADGIARAASDPRGSEIGWY